MKFKKKIVGSRLGRVIPETNRREFRRRRGVLHGEGLVEGGGEGCVGVCV